MGIALLALIATFTFATIEPSLRSAKIKATHDRLLILEDALSRYYDTFCDFPPERPSDELERIMEERLSRPANPLDALAVNPFVYDPDVADDNPDQKLENQRWEAWDLNGPFVSSEFVSGSYLKDGWQRTLRYVYPFPYDESGRYDFGEVCQEHEYDEICTADDGNVPGRCKRALVYSLGADGVDHLNRSGSSVEIDWEKDVNLIVIPPA